MNKIKEQIIKYLDGSMSEEDKLHFEKLLTKDSELSRETDEIRNFLSGTKADAEPDTNETYFVNMLPEFYSRHEKKQKFIFSKAAYSLSTAAVVILILFIVFKPAGTVNYSNLNELSRSFTQTELDETFNQFADQYSISDLMSSASTKTDSIVSNLVVDELDLSGYFDKTITDKYVNTDELLNSIDETEADQLYSQLINEDIIKGAKQ